VCASAWWCHCAISAVLGSQTTYALGYQFVITPVLLNVGIILLVGFLYNYMFRWRRYPVYLHRSTKQQEEIHGAETPAKI
jgi:CBS-domain-containing membrane protein